jgi:tetratricopeptide (TPR) repeat protein
LLASLTSLSEATEDQKFAEALTAELATPLARTGLLDLKLVAAGPVVAGEELRKLARSQNTYWAVSGVLQSPGKSQRANVYAMNVGDGGVIWSQDYNFDTDRRAPGALADAIMLDLRPQLYSAAKRRLEAKRDPTPLELFVLATWSPGVETNSLEWQLERIALARRAIAADSRFGPAHSVLADKPSLLANLDPAFDTEEAWREAAAAARQAGVLSPHSSEVAFNLVLYHFHLGDHDEALKLVRRTLDLDPGHTLARIWISALPYYCERAPVAVVDELAAFDAGLAPSNPARWQAKTWLARLNLNNGNYRAAVEAARESMQIVPNLGAALVLAVAQVQMGEIEDARRVMADQRSYWKGFSFDHNNSVVLPRHCKSSSILDRLQAIHREAAAAIR